MKIRNVKLWLSTAVIACFSMAANAADVITLDDVQHSQKLLLTPDVAALVEAEGPLSILDERLVCAANQQGLSRRQTFCVTMAEAQDYAAQHPADFEDWQDGRMNRIVVGNTHVVGLTREDTSGVILSAGMRALLDEEGELSTADDRVHCVRRRAYGASLRENRCQTQDEYFWQQVAKVNYRIHYRRLRADPRPRNGDRIFLDPQS